MLLLDHSTDYFECLIGVKQGDSLSPTLFAVFINDLVRDIKETCIGVLLETKNNLNDAIERVVISILLYADDIVLFAQNEEDMQSLLFIVEIWCQNWRLEVNLAKTNILQVRAKRKPQSKFVFLFGKRIVEYCTSYKYLGCYLNEFLDFNFTAEMQANSASRALNSIVTKMIKRGGFPYTVYSMLYQACILSISQYAGEIFGFRNYDSHFKLQLRAIRAFLGLPKNATSFGILSEFDWLLPQYQGQLKMVHFLDRIFRLPNSRLVSKVYQWDRHLNDSGQIYSWSSEVKEILDTNNLEFVL